MEGSTPANFAVYRLRPVKRKSLETASAPTRALPQRAAFRAESTAPGAPHRTHAISLLALARAALDAFDDATAAAPIVVHDAEA